MGNIDHKKSLEILQKVRDKIKNSDVIQDMCKEYGVDVNYIDLIPMCFAELSVSARTDKGCIYFNISLLEDGSFEKDDHYMVHEARHHFQQCFSDGPTEAPTLENYLDNEHEQEGFRDQTEYLSETRGDGAAESYIEKVLRHHDVPENEKEERKKELLAKSIEEILEIRKHASDDNIYYVYHHFDRQPDVDPANFSSLFYSKEEAIRYIQNLIDENGDESQWVSKIPDEGERAVAVISYPWALFNAIIYIIVSKKESSLEPDFRNESKIRLKISEKLYNIINYINDYINKIPNNALLMLKDIGYDIKNKQLSLQEINMLWRNEHPVFTVYPGGPEEIYYDKIPIGSRKDRSAITSYLLRLENTAGAKEVAMDELIDNGIVTDEPSDWLRLKPEDVGGLSFWVMNSHLLD